MINDRYFNRLEEAENEAERKRNYLYAWQKANPERVRASQKRWKQKKRMISYCAKHRIPRIQYEWHREKTKWIIKSRKVILRTYSRIWHRCEDKKTRCYKYYGARGIRCSITKEELEFLWHRDYAANMKRPSIDRIDPDGSYELDNCRFMELSENSKRARKRGKKIEEVSIL